MAETENTLSKVDSLVEGEKKPAHRRASSLNPDVKNMADLGESLPPVCHCVIYPDRHDHVGLTQGNRKGQGAHRDCARDAKAELVSEP